MKAGRVVGTVTMSDAAPQFRGARWLLVCPMGAEELSNRNEYGSGWTPVVYDRLGAGVGTPFSTWKELKRLNPLMSLHRSMPLQSRSSILTNTPRPPRLKPNTLSKTTQKLS